MYKLSEYLYTKLNIIHTLYIFVKLFLSTIVFSILVFSIYILITQKLLAQILIFQNLKKNHMINNLQ